MTARRRSDAHRIVRWLWTSRRIDARLTRAFLVPASLVWRATMRFRAGCYRRGWLKSRSLPLPSVVVGNLSVGGSGKTPIASWIAGRFAGKQHRPGILLRGVGGDEALVHQEAVPAAIVVPDPDRHTGAEIALAMGATVLVLDDAYQRLDVRRDMNICVISAETSRAVSWNLPAGPWRESWRALNRADAVIVTRKRADHETAVQLATRVAREVHVPVAVARLDLSMLEGMISGNPRPVQSISGKRVVAACAIADPAAFISQVKRTGAQVQVATWKDHHDFRDEDIAWLAHAARRADHLVVTAKDAVKLRARWPASVPEPLVAMLSVTFEAGEQELCEALDELVSSSRHDSEPSTSP